MSKRKKRGWIVAVVAVVIMIAMVVLLMALRSQKLANSEVVTIYIPSGSDYESVTDSLEAHGCIGDKVAFDALARLRRYKDNVKGGCYKLDAQMPVWTALTKLYYGNQDAIRVTIGKHRLKNTLCAYVGGRLEMNSQELDSLLGDSAVCASYGLDRENIIGMFVQNTYDIYWNTSATSFMDRMKKESDRFWNKERMRRCKDLNLSPSEVIVVASIVEEETNKSDEKADIASVYLNRLRKGMMLQADPTLKYALGDFSIRRLLNKHMEVESPYNTYKHKGLPPGPICIPSIESIDAVLQNKKTDYLYFCAKSDFSGGHAFATTLAEHNANAKAFHDAMNKRRIY